MTSAAMTFRPGLFGGHQVLVSGGTSGIGLAIARGFAGLGATVLATGSSPTKVAALQAEGAPENLTVRVLDVRDRAAVRDLVGSLQSLDVLVNAAGIARPHREFEEDTFLEVMDVNLNAAMRLAMAARPLLARRGGSILNVGSMLSYVADPAVPAYGASKAGVLGLTRHLAHAFGPEGIRVNAISPGYHRTEMTRELWADPTAAARIEGRTALRRWGTTEDLVGAALFLASPAAAYATGTDLPIDGGYVASGLI